MAKKTIQAEGLTPGINYVVQIFSTHTDNLGQTIVSKYSAPIAITTPGVSAGGGNLSATNFKTDMRLAGGSFYVGSFQGTKGVIALVDNLGVPITLTSTESGLIINKYGIAAYNAGVPEFTLDAVSGRAIFAGRVQAGTIKIGPKVDPTGTKNGIYINTKNYWYDDGTFKVNAQDVAKSLEGTDTVVNPQVTPTGVTNFAGTWNTTTGATLRLTWDFDSSDANNAFVKEFIILFTSGGVTKSVTVLATERIFDLTETINKSLFVFFKDTFTSIGIFASPKYGSVGPTVYLGTVPTYVSSLAAPTSLSVTTINNGYTVTYTKPTSSAYSGITIEETTTSPGTSGFGAVPASSEVKSSLDPTKNIVTVMTSDLNQRWVRAKFYDTNGTFTSYSPTYAVTPNSPVVINTSAPGNVTVYSDSVIFQTYNSVAYAGDDLDVYFDIPSTGSGDTFVVKLTPPGVSKNGYFYFPKTTFPNVSSALGDGSGTIVYTTASAHGLQIGKKVTVGGFTTTGYNVSNKTISAVTTSSPYTFTVTSAGNQTGASTGTGTILTQYGTIAASLMNDQFGSHYNSFTGFLISIGSNGVENTSPPSITVPSRVSSLSSYKPSIRTIAISNGFSSTYSLVGTNAARAEIYYRYSTWSGVTDPVDYYSGTYSSGGANGATSLLINGVTNHNGTTIAPLSGYPINGTGIQSGTYVTSVTGTGPYTLNLSKSLNAQASGTYTASALVYDGLSPANIFTSVYVPTYVIGRYYDDYDSGSLVSDETVITPIDAGAVDATAPDVPTLSVYTTGANQPTYNSLTVNIASTDTSTRGYYLRYRIGTGLYTTINIPITTGTSLTVDKLIPGLLPSTAYKFSVASFDQFNNVSAYTSEVTGTTIAQTVSPVTSLVVKNIEYGINAKWVAPANPVTAIKGYKVELYSGASLQLTDYTFSTVYDFANLTVGSAYTVKVYTQDVYDVLATAVTSSSITVKATATDGNAPSASPNAPTITPLFGAFEVKWAAISNNDPVTYEVHISTTNGFTPSAGTKVMETSGTLAIVRTLPGSTSPLTYGTLYYVKIWAKDTDGYASAGTQSSGTPQTISTADIGGNQITGTLIEDNAITTGKITAGSITSDQLAANSVIAGKIFASSVTTEKLDANAVTADKVNTNALTTKTFQVGAVGSNPMYLDGAGTYTATYSGGGLVNRIYAGTGTFSAKNTPFYLDTAGYFSLKDTLTFVPGTSLEGGSLTVNGVINATSGDFKGAVTVNATSMKIGKGVNPINEPTTGTAAGAYDGIHINKNSYWYTNGNFGIGAAAGLTPSVSWDGTDLNVIGNITASSGKFTGNVLIDTNGGLVAGKIIPVSITAASASGTYITYTTGTKPHGLVASNIVTISGITPTGFNLTSVSVFDAPTTTTFRVANALASGTTYSSGGTVQTARITLTNSSLKVYDSAGTQSTIIYSDALYNVDQTAVSNITFYTTNAQIGDWRVTPSAIENIATKDKTAGSKYTGLSASKTDYSFWAGATSTGNTDNTAPFSVTPLGQLNASNIKITGGQLDVGSSSYVTATSQAAVLGATTLTMSNTAVAGVSVAISSVTAGTYFVSGTNIALGTTITYASGTSLTLSKPTIGAVASGAPIKLLAYSGAHITSEGYLFAKDSVFIGDITAKSGYFTGNIVMDTGGSIYQGTLNSGGTAVTGAGFYFNKDGLVFNSASTAGIIQLLAADKTVDGVVVPTGTLLAKQAIIGPTSGGWNINTTTNAGTMYSTTTAGTIYLDSSAPKVYAQTTGNTYSVGFRLPPNQAATDSVIWAGSAGVGSSANQFVVQADGKLNATGAVVSGSVAATTILVGAQSTATITGATANGTTTVTYTTSVGTGWVAGQTIVVTGVTPGVFNVGGKITSVVGSTITVTASDSVSGSYSSGGTARIAGGSSSMSFNSVDGFKIAAGTNYLQFDGGTGFKLTGGQFNIGDGTANSIILKASPTPTMTFYANQAFQGQIISSGLVTGAGGTGIALHTGGTSTVLGYPAIMNYKGGPFGDAILLVTAETKGLFLNATSATIEGYASPYTRQLRNAISVLSYTSGTAGSLAGDIVLVLS